jgi:hemerythrin
MSKISKRDITPGVVWIEVKEADLYLCCGCPADTIKHLKKSGLIQQHEKDGWHYESGPNAILLSDTLIQNGKLANLSEFVVMHMLYLQGIFIPGHPNYLKFKPLLIGYEKQLRLQQAYVAVGNHGLETVQEISDEGIRSENAEKIFATKLHYAGGEIKKMDQLMQPIVLEDQPVDIKNGVQLRRLGLNKFQLFYENEYLDIDLNLPLTIQYEAPYQLPFRKFNPSRFSVIHTGEGNGWDVKRPCMASIIHFEGRVYLVDAGPNILNNLSRLGIGLSQIEGIFLSHIHDDHFAGITDLLNVEKKLNLFSTRLIRKTIQKKLNALFDSEIDLLDYAFNWIELTFNQWSDIEGLEVVPYYSPHTVETSIFKFRAKYHGNTKTYLHLADTINLKEFRKIIDNNPDILTEKDFERTRSRYLSAVSLKKLDVGGGLIHGHLEDYTKDESEKLVMAHTDEELKVVDPRFVNAEFGDADNLIDDGEFEFSARKADDYLKMYFPTLPINELSRLAENKKHEFAPGQRIELNEKGSSIFLLLNGIVSCKNQMGYEQRLDAGNFFGTSVKYFRQDAAADYHALSYADCLSFTEVTIDRIFERYNLEDGFRSRVNITEFLQDSYLVQTTLSRAVYYDLSGASEIVNIPNADFNDEMIAKYVFVILEGTIDVVFEHQYRVKIGKHQHFGGLNLLNKYRREQKFVFPKMIKAVAIPIEKLMHIPVLLWKLIELEEKRYQLSIFETK